MGVERYLIISTVNGVLAQRLVWRLCGHCKAALQPAPALLQSSGLGRFLPEGAPIYKAVGCERCNGSGYKGRVGIYQVMPISEEIQRIILNSGNAMEIAAQAKREGVNDLRTSGLIKVKQGLTTIEEVLGVTNE